MDKRQQIIYKALEESGIIKEIEEVARIKEGDIGKDMIKTAMALELQRLYEENENLRLGIAPKKKCKQPKEMNKTIKRIKELDSMVKYLQRIYKRDTEVSPNLQTWNAGFEKGQEKAKKEHEVELKKLFTQLKKELEYFEDDRVIDCINDFMELNEIGEQNEK